MLGDVADAFATWSLRALGATETEFWFELSAGELKTLDFLAAGVPADAEIIAVEYLPHRGNCMPIETVTYHIYRRAREKRTGVVGAPIPGAAHRPPSRVRASVYWVRGEEQGEAWRLIADALAAAARGDYTGVIAPAHAAVEITLARLIADVFHRHVGRDSVRRFITNDLSSEAAMNVVLPFLCGVAKVPAMSSDVRGRLTRLRSLRNQLAHEGVTSLPVDEREVRELLVAAVIAFEYLRFVRPMLTAA